MGCMDQALSNLFPVSWLDPYGNMPLNKEHTVQIDITQVETDDGIKVTAIKTPPRAGTTSIQDAISMALGMGCDEIGPQNGLEQSADLGKRDDKKSSGKNGKCDTMKSTSPESSEQGSQPWGSGKSSEEQDDKSPEKGAKKDPGIK